MGVIGILRKRAGLMIIVVGVALFSFILTDLLGQASKIVGSGENVVGKINDNEILYGEYDNKVKERINDYKSQSQKASISDREQFQIKEAVWQEMIKQKMDSLELGKLGLEVSDQEWVAMHSGDNVHPLIKQQFTDPATGDYQKQLSNFLMNVDEDPETKRRWGQFKAYLVQQKIDERYQSLFKKSVYVPSWEAMEHQKNVDGKSDVSYVLMPYSDLNEDIEIADAEIETYFQGNKEKYKSKDELRRIEYVQFKVYPSNIDSSEAKEEILAHKARFMSSEDDSLYLTLNSEVPYSKTYLIESEINSIRKDSIMSLEPGSFIGPFIENGQYSVVKVLDKKLIPDSVKARHILFEVKSQEEYNTALLQIDSVKEALRGGESFESLAKRYSKDPGSKDKGGDLGWVKPRTMVPSVHNALFYTGDKGDYQTVLSNFGLHLIDVQNYRPSSLGINYGIVSTSISAGEQTIDSVFNIANNFLYGVMSVEGEKGVNQMDGYIEKNEGFNKRTPDAFNSRTFEIPGIGEANQLVKWAFNAKLGDVDIQNLNNADNYIVLALAEVREAESLPEEAVIQIENALMKEKQSALLMDKYSDALSKSSLEEIASASNHQLLKVSGVSFSNAYNPGVGRDLAFTGQVAGLKEGQTSKAFKGDKGVYVVRVDKRNLEEKEDYSVSANALKLLKERSLTNRVQQALIDKAAAEDFRYKLKQ